MSAPPENLMTESRNPASSHIDTLSTLEMLKVMNAEDKKVALAVELALPSITQAVDLISAAFHKKGRLIYCGAGTSGRLGILDASECPPTFGTPAKQVMALIAGGHRAILKAVENAEDNLQAGQSDLQNINFNENDILVGIAASGSTPYVIGAMRYAKSINAQVIAINCNPNSLMSKECDVNICAVVGPEVLTGSSRLKAGTAQKLILNMLTTGAMIRTGKVFGNLMVDVQATNAKLVERQKMIVIAATDCLREEAEKALLQCNGHCKTAIVMILTNTNTAQAKSLLAKNNGYIRQSIVK
ncbi:glucokinase regulatory-like protein [Psychromonas ingrahamii 37]|uniref:N-acetylmuramic acid 6-phosphate etherase n=1 Tax=Psychromonas ingrahamii (strain DSM 17664 / CCUG 51855 / 37) TaxID=357804 RepID=MURQ_PSYIN|nr:N-acetylmuramic acid 6-phosphate etherase [Psychromonas ingrahamii]A1STT9.1 RecName: Full=N-acetylmuramic acid 6-phosphate etherase; Short=MurNAc-6-P etherase; AltName: Full=N-acetylmuramic acid 6-phosphate hydrolase; AltName: Full=N-acetylmuramic acid 6-phosphate lyase [Psychromonas ingrahamii 37]ABM02904.1 glucokinase regulatory-like protein [Psychromonas ingrahamii 37]